MKAEDKSAEIRSYLVDWVADGHAVVSGELLETELWRVAQRCAVPEHAVTSVLNEFNVVAHRSADFRLAGHIPDAQLGSLDALHLATALRIGADAMLTDDQRLAEAAEQAGIPVLDTAIPRTLHG